MTKKKSSKEEKEIMICPKCKSPNVHLDNSNPLQPAMGLPPKYVCNNCGYSGYVFPKIKLSELKKFEDKIKKEPFYKMKKHNSSIVDTSYGNFEVKVFWKISAPITFLVGIFLLFKEPILGAIITLLGIFMFYITYFKKRKLKN